MVDRPKSADAFARTRDDHATEIAEDYVEAVADLVAEKGACRVTDLAAAFGVSHVTVVRVVQRLEKEGLVATERQQPIRLTPAGLELAEHCRRRHDIVYRFLLAIGVEPHTAAIDSEGIEHHVSAETLECFRRVVAREET